MIVPGLLLAVGLALLAETVAHAFAQGWGGLPTIPLSAVLCAVLVGMGWRNALGVPRWSEPGIGWAMHYVLRTGIALVGLRLTLAGAGVIAVTALPVVVGCLAVALIAGVVVARTFGVPRRLGTLLAIGTAVCGCTAVIALSPVIRARSAETAFAVTCVVLFGCIGMLCYPWIAGHLFDASPVHAGVFLGTAIHDTSQVVGSALIYSQQLGSEESLAAASVTKLLRNLSIAVLIPAAAWMSRNAPHDDAPAEPAPGAQVVPFFVIGFILLVVGRTAGDAWFGTGGSWSTWVSRGQSLSEFLLICGMAAVGLSVSFTQMWRIGWRPLAAGLVLALIVAATSVGLTLASSYVYK